MQPNLPGLRAQVRACITAARDVHGIGHRGAGGALTAHGETCGDLQPARPLQYGPFSRPKSITIVMGGGGGLRPYNVLPCAYGGKMGSGWYLSSSSASPSARSLSICAGSETFRCSSKRARIRLVSSNQCHLLAIHDSAVLHDRRYRRIKRKVRSGNDMMSAVVLRTA